MPKRPNGAATRSPDVAAAMRGAGLHRLYMPRRYGGYGIDWGAHYVAGERLSRECGSTGWIASLVFSHIMYVGRFPVEAQDEFFGSDRDPVLATGSAGGGAIRREGNDWRLKGRWSFVSGVNVADGVMIVARENGEGPISHFILLMPGEYTVHDTWHSEGLRGTGSHDVTVDDILVPARRVLTMQQFTSMSPPAPRSPRATCTACARRRTRRAGSSGRCSARRAARLRRTSSRPGPAPAASWASRS